ncbi:MAG: GtrA family protein [Clostridia bacterium]|nr:GtrA family protein [Clostridia bacterium]
MKPLWQRLRGVIDVKLLKFLLVGGINTVVGLGIELFMYNVLLCGVWVSSATNYVLTSILSFFLNKYFTFRSQERSWREVLRFALNIAVCYLLAHGIAVPLMDWLLRGADETLRGNVTLLTGMCLFTGLNYLGQRFFAFAEKKSR